MAINSNTLLLEVVDYLAEHGIDVWVFGGWAEELNKMVEPRSHRDFDLFYFSQDFNVVDEFIKNERILEILGKHFHHKRAFEYEGILTELFLIEKDENGFYTNFWGKKRYYWPDDLKGELHKVKIITPAALNQYRSDYPIIENLRKK